MVTTGPALESVQDRVGDVLRRRGERLTTPRRTVIQALAGHGGHASSEELVGEVQALDPAIHRSSVYRTLEVLSRAGVVQHVHLARGGTAYHLMEALHAHGQCTACGVIVDLEPGVFDALAPAVLASSGFVVDPVHVALAGLCARCAPGVTTPPEADGSAAGGPRLTRDQ